MTSLVDRPSSRASQILRLLGRDAALPSSIARAFSLLRSAASTLFLTGLLAACGGGGGSPATAVTETVKDARQAAVATGVAVQYVRLQSTSEVNGNPWASMAEFNLVDANGATLSRAGWSVVADSQELVGENAPATNAIDGDPNTIWHTQWQGASPPNPHTFTVNLGAARSIGGFRYLPRQVGVNGRIAGYRFYTSSDGNVWTLAAEGTFPNASAEVTVMTVQGPTVTALADRMDPVGRAVTQAVTANDASGGTLNYAASGLPSGLAIDPASGKIAGTPTVAGVYAVTVQVGNGRATTAASFAWTITGTGSAGITAQYVRLEALSEVNGNAWTSIAEFNVVDAGGSTLSHAGWSVGADSQELVGENAPATNAIDGDPNTIWHTQWQGASPTPPHALTVNLGALRSIGGFRYLPRQVGVNGRIAGYRFYTSTNGTTWTLANEGVFPNTASEQAVTLTAQPGNQPPVVATPANRTDTVGQPVSQAVQATDPNGDALSYAATGLPTGLSINGTTGLIAGTPGATGSFAVTIQVSDGRATTTAGFTWTISAAPNQPPVLAAIASRSDTAGRAASQIVSATDPDGDALTYAASGLPTGLTINAATGLIAGAPTTTGGFGVTVQVNDGRATTSTAFTWTIVPAPNLPPVLTAVASRSDPVGRAVSQAVSATDPDGDRLTYSATGLPTGLGIDGSTGLISGVPTVVGSFAAAVQVSDGRATVQSGFAWTILPAPNQPPVLNPVPSRSDPVGKPVTQSVSATDADNDALTYSATGLPGGLTINAVNGLIAGTPATAGTFGVTLQVSDGRATTSGNFTWTIVANRPPVLGALTNRSDPTGQAVAQAVTASDPDGDTLTYSASGLPTGLGINTATGLISGTPGTAGAFTVVVQVSDGRNTASGSFTWTISAASSGVTARFVRLEAISEVNGNPWTSMAEFNVVDGNGALIPRSGWTVVADSQELVGENAPATNAIDGDPNTLWHTQWQGAVAPMPHTFTVNLGASRTVGGFRYLPRQVGVNGRIAGYRFYTSNDGTSWQVVTQGTFANSTGEQTGTVAGGITNQPPTLATLPATRQDTLGASVSLALVASDPNGDTLTYAATGLPTGLSINASSGVISGTASTAGTYATTVSVSDGRGGAASQLFNWIVAAQSTAPPGSSGTNPPIVFNATTSAAAGDVIFLQGDGFGTAPTVTFDGVPGTALEIVNRVGTGWLAVQIPSTATGALVLRIANGTGISAAIRLNAARPYHLDTTQLAPGGAFRLYGRNLKVAGSTPSVTVNGLAATIDVANSNEHLLLVTAPTSLSAASVVSVVADNGNGSGASPLDRSVAIVTSGGGDPFALGVGWGASFATIASRTIYPASDGRIGDKAACNGSHDDANAIQQAIDLAASSGGGVVQLPAGRCVTGSILTLRSNVVVRGAGKTSTEIWHSVSNYPFVGQGIDLAGLGDLTISNTVDGADSMIFKESTRVFLKNLRINIGTGRQMYLSDNVNFVFAGTDVYQTGNVWQQGPYTLSNASGLVFENNATTWVTGAPTFGRIHDSAIRSSHFTRNATNPNVQGAVHSLTLDFAYRVSVIGNLLDVLGGPIRDKQRNDGETILTEGGGAQRTENVGTVGSATATTMTDTGNTLVVDPFGTGSIPETYGVVIVAGKGAGQMRHLVAYSSGTKTLTVDKAWDVIPDGSSRYATMVFGLEKALIKANTLSQNPRGIWLYNTGIRDVDVIGNTLSEGGGIYLRSYQQIGTKTLTTIYGVLIKDNQISNTTGNWMSYINIVQVNGDGSAFGTGILGVEVRNNTITANRPNVYSNVEEYAGTEGMMVRMPLESGGAYQSTSMPRVLGTILNGNTCTYCDVGVRIGTGSNGTTLLNTRLPGSTSLYTDTSSVPTGETATGTVVR